MERPTRSQQRVLAALVPAHEACLGFGGKPMTAASPPAVEIASSDIWKATRRLHLYGRTDTELEALIAAS